MSSLDLTSSSTSSLASPVLSAQTSPTSSAECFDFARHPLSSATTLAQVQRAIDALHRPISPCPDRDLCLCVLETASKFHAHPILVHQLLLVLTKADSSIIPHPALLHLLDQYAFPTYVVSTASKILLGIAQQTPALKSVIAKHTVSLLLPSLTLSTPPPAQLPLDDACSALPLVNLVYVLSALPATCCILEPLAPALVALLPPGMPASHYFAETSLPVTALKALHNLALNSPSCIQAAAIASYLDAHRDNEAIYLWRAGVGVLCALTAVPAPVDTSATLLAAIDLDDLDTAGLAVQGLTRLLVCNPSLLPAPKLLSLLRTLCPCPDLVVQTHALLMAALPRALPVDLLFSSPKHAFVFSFLASCLFKHHLDGYRIDEHNARLTLKILDLALKSDYQIANNDLVLAWASRVLAKHSPLALDPLLDSLIKVPHTAAAFLAFCRSLRLPDATLHHLVLVSLTIDYGLEGNDQSLALVLQTLPPPPTLPSLLPVLATFPHSAASMLSYLQAVSPDQSTLNRMATVALTTNLDTLQANDEALTWALRVFQPSSDVDLINLFSQAAAKRHSHVAIISLVQHLMSLNPATSDQLFLLLLKLDFNCAGNDATLAFTLANLTKTVDLLPLLELVIRKTQSTPLILDLASRAMSTHTDPAAIVKIFCLVVHKSKDRPGDDKTLEWFISHLTNQPSLCSTVELKPILEQLASKPHTWAQMRTVAELVLPSDSARALTLLNVLLSRNFGEADNLQSFEWATSFISSKIPPADFATLDLAPILERLLFKPAALNVVLCWSKTVLAQLPLNRHASILAVLCGRDAGLSANNARLDWLIDIVSSYTHEQLATLDITPALERLANRPHSFYSLRRLADVVMAKLGDNASPSTVGKIVSIVLYGSYGEAGNREALAWASALLLSKPDLTAFNLVPVYERLIPKAPNLDALILFTGAVCGRISDSARVLRLLYLVCTRDMGTTNNDAFIAWMVSFVRSMPDIAQLDFAPLVELYAYRSHNMGPMLDLVQMLVPRLGSDSSRVKLLATFLRREYMASDYGRALVCTVQLLTPYELADDDLVVLVEIAVKRKHLAASMVCLLQLIAAKLPPSKLVASIERLLHAVLDARNDEPALLIEWATQLLANTPGDLVLKLPPLLEMLAKLPPAPQSTTAMIRVLVERFGLDAFWYDWETHAPLAKLIVHFESADAAALYEVLGNDPTFQMQIAFDSLTCVKNDSGNVACGDFHAALITMFKQCREDTRLLKTHIDMGLLMRIQTLFHHSCVPLADTLGEFVIHVLRTQPAYDALVGSWTYEGDDQESKPWIVFLARRAFEAKSAAMCQFLQEPADKLSAAVYLRGLGLTGLDPDFNESIVRHIIETTKQLGSQAIVDMGLDLTVLVRVERPLELVLDLLEVLIQGGNAMQVLEISALMPLLVKEAVGNQRAMALLCALEPDLLIEDEVVNQMTKAALIEAATCAICRGFIKGPMACAPCAHAFCAVCLKEWMAKSPNTNCPMCRWTVHGQVVSVRTFHVLKVLRDKFQLEGEMAEEE